MGAGWLIIEGATSSYDCIRVCRSSSIAVNLLPRSLLIFLAMACGAAPCAAIEHVTIRNDGRLANIMGKSIVEAEDGGILLLSTDGSLWPVPPEDLVERRIDEAAFAALSREQLAQQLLGELPPGFQIHSTAHYLVCYNTSREYAQWCGSLFERLYRVFQNYWSRKGLQLREPEFPLVAIIFDNRASYSEFARGELQESVDSVIGYYSLQTNRMTMFDLTGLQTGRRGGSRNTSEQISEILAQPQAERNVATIIHEATHQIAFNCGLHTRFADIPLWVSEGVAVYFEAPDASDKGWRSIGEINRVRLDQFRQYMASRPENSLETLIVDDKRFRDPKIASDAYAEAWALNYYLLKVRSKQYVQYLHKLAAKPPLVWDSPEQRLKEFEDAFGDLRKLDAEMLRQIGRLN